MSKGEIGMNQIIILNKWPTILTKDASFAANFEEIFKAQKVEGSIIILPQDAILVVKDD